ncbi:MAG: molybdopterin-dependent oxidoreductase, partial [Planctomycetes bacterium]|nr:molybdopterin-dependent oxidoreductase [Planctomycetota bacterium]
MPGTSLSRREFLKASGVAMSALVIGVSLDQAELIEAQGMPRDQLAGATEAELPEGSFVPSMWLAILPSGAVKIWAHRSEMGTGIRTSLPMIVADELEADWEQVELVQGLGDADFGDQNTDGSRSVRQFYQTMRVAGASARLLLERAAAAKWGVEAERCQAEKHQVKGPDGKTLSFGDLVADAKKQAMPQARELRFKKKSERRFVGKEEVRLYDCRDMITGKANYGADMQLEGMLTAVILRPWTLNAELTELKEERALQEPGVVKVLQIPRWKGPGPGFQPLGGVAVIAESTYAAMRGRDRLHTSFKTNGDEEFSSEVFRKALGDSANARGKPIRRKGDASKAMQSAASQHSADYHVPFLAHASMEP